MPQIGQWRRCEIAATTKKAMATGTTYWTASCTWMKAPTQNSRKWPSARSIRRATTRSRLGNRRKTATAIAVAPTRIRAARHLIRPTSGSPSLVLGLVDQLVLGDPGHHGAQARTHFRSEERRVGKE